MVFILNLAYHPLNPLFNFTMKGFLQFKIIDSFRNLGYWSSYLNNFSLVLIFSTFPPLGTTLNWFVNDSHVSHFNANQNLFDQINSQYMDLNHPQLVMGFILTFPSSIFPRISHLKIMGSFSKYLHYSMALLRLAFVLNLFFTKVSP
jgi:hypothetical protein